MPGRPRFRRAALRSVPRALLVERVASSVPDRGDEHLHEIGLARDLQQEHVAGLEIAVNDALIVGSAQRRCDLPDHVDNRLDGSGACAPPVNAIASATRGTVKCCMF